MVSAIGVLLCIVVIVAALIQLANPNKDEMPR